MLVARTSGEQGQQDVSLSRTLTFRYPNCHQGEEWKRGAHKQANMPRGLGSRPWHKISRDLADQQRRSQDPQRNDPSSRLTPASLRSCASALPGSRSGGTRHRAPQHGKPGAVRNPVPSISADAGAFAFDQRLAPSAIVVCLRCAPSFRCLDQLGIKPGPGTSHATSGKLDRYFGGWRRGTASRLRIWPVSVAPRGTATSSLCRTS